MSPPTAAAGGHTPSRSAIVAATARGRHLLQVDGYSGTKGVRTGEHVRSRPFTAGGHRWRIDYYPNGRSPEDAEYISLFLLLDDDDDGAAKNVKARVRFSFAGDADTVAPPALASLPTREFSTGAGVKIKASWGDPKFVKRESLEKSRHLRDDSFTVRCDVVVVVVNRCSTLAEQDTAAPASVSVPPFDLQRHLGGLLETGKGAEVVFQVGGETFAAHRCVLAARSPVLSSELFGPMKEGNAAAAAGGTVRIHDMDAQVFRAFLQFAYTDSLPTPETEEDENDDVMFMCQHLLVVADRYGMERLKLICEQKLCDYVVGVVARNHVDGVGTVATILAVAEQHRCDGLKNACLHFLSSPAILKATMASEGFKHLSTSCPSVLIIGGQPGRASRAGPVAHVPGP